MSSVSVIVPNYNHARFLRQRVDSILAQTCQDLELILLDDASTDESREILQTYRCDPRVKLHFNEVNSGNTFKQWNAGVSLAQGKYVWIAESDDYAAPHLLERLVSTLDAEPEAVFACCRSWRVAGDGEPQGLVDPNPGDAQPERWAADFYMDGAEMCRRYFSRRNVVPNASAVVFRKDAFLRLGGADQSLRSCGDWKLWAALAMQGRVAYVSEPMNYFRSHEATVRNQSVRATADVAEHLSVCDWVLRQAHLPDAVREQVCRSVAGYWVAALVSLRVPLEVKRSILRKVAELDPHPFRRIIRPLAATVRLKFQRHWREARSPAPPTGPSD